MKNVFSHTLLSGADFADRAVIELLSAPGARCTTRQIVERTQQIAAKHDRTSRDALGAHMTHLKSRAIVESDGRSWAMTALGRELAAMQSPAAAPVIAINASMSDFEAPTEAPPAESPIEAPVSVEAVQTGDETAPVAIEVVETAPSDAELLAIEVETPAPSKKRRKGRKGA